MRETMSKFNLIKEALGTLTIKLLTLETHMDRWAQDSSEAEEEVLKKEHVLVA
jgi:hypothetical protein